MEFFRIKKDIPFMRHALVFNVISAITFLLAVFFLVTRGLHLGVEFTGGMVMEVRYAHAADLDKVRATLEQHRPAATRPCRASAARESALIRLPARQDVTGAELSEKVFSALQAGRSHGASGCAWSSSARRSARSWWKTARSRCCWCRR